MNQLLHELTKDSQFRTRGKDDKSWTQENLNYTYETVTNDRKEVVRLMFTYPEFTADDF
jgi:hypothetical protein